MAEVYNFDGYQIPHIGLTDQDLGGAGAASNRGFASRMSSFGDLRFGNRSGDDYTRILYQDKDITEKQNPDIPEWADDNAKNPLLVGSTRKRTRDDEFTVMGIGNRRSNSATDQPGFDVSDSFAATDDGGNAPKQFPREGWRTFGGRNAGPANYVAPGHNPVTA